MPSATDTSLAAYGYNDSPLLQDPIRLAQQNMFLLSMQQQENARLARENMLLRLQLQDAQLQERYIGGTGKDKSISEMSASAGSSLAGSLDATRNQSRAPSAGAGSYGNDCEKTATSASASGSQSPVAPERTTVMMRNLPNDYTREMLLNLLVDEGYAGRIDMLYLPIDFKSQAGLGYAFINFVESEVAEGFCQRFSGFTSWRVASDKVCEVSWSDALQGLQANIEHYRNSPVMHESVPDEFKPLLFSGCERLSFPPPSRKIRAPRHWNRRR